MFLQGKRSAFELEWAPGVTWGDVYRESERQWSIYNFEEAPVDVLVRRFGEHEDECASPDRAAAAAARLRPGAQVLARAQPPRRPRRRLGDGARRVHPPRAEPHPQGRKASTWRCSMPSLLVEIGCEELPAAACTRPRPSSATTCAQPSGSSRRRSSSRPAASRSSSRTRPPNLRRPGLRGRRRARRHGEGRVRPQARGRTRRARGARRPARHRAARAAVGRGREGAARRARLRALLLEVDAVARRRQALLASGPLGARQARRRDDRRRVVVRAPVRLRRGRDRPTPLDISTRCARQASSPTRTSGAGASSRGSTSSGPADDPLGKLDEVVHMVEWPVVLEATFDEAFLRLPRARDRHGDAGASALLPARRQPLRARHGRR